MAMHIWLNAIYVEGGVNVLRRLRIYHFTTYLLNLYCFIVV